KPKRPSAPALSQQSVSYLHEAGYVGTINIVDRAVFILAEADTSSVDIAHDEAQAVIDFFARPRQPHGILRHLEARGRHPARVTGFARSKQNTRLMKLFGRFQRAWHIGAFGHA